MPSWLVLLGVLLAFSSAARINRRKTWSKRGTLHHQQRDSRQGPSLQTACGLLKGAWAEPEELQSDATTVAAYRGIQFGTAERWMPPKELCPEDGFREATADGPICPQNVSYASVQSEECLYLDLFVPEVPKADSLPIVVWLHGGALLAGSANSYYQVPVSLAQLWLGEVVVVACQHRLGVLGFISTPELSMRDPRNVSGNYGVLDVELCLQWVQKNAPYFGGDNSSVTLLGHSSGGTVIMGLIGSDAPQQGLFHRGIVMSYEPGTPSLNQAEKEQQDVSTWLPKTPCNGSTEVLQCLLGLSASELIMTLPVLDYFLFDPRDLPTAPAPKGRIGEKELIHVDGVTVKNLTDTQLLTGLPVPLLIQSMQAELAGSGWYNGYDLNNTANWKAFLSSIFTPGFGADFADKVQQVYSSVQPNTLAAYNLDSDTGDFCGGLVHPAKVLASLGISHPPLYLLRIEAGPSHPIYWESCTATMEYPFHGWEVAAASERWNLMYAMYCQPYTPTGVDLKLSAWMRKTWLEFAVTGLLTDGGWTPAVSSSIPVADFQDDNRYMIFRNNGTLDLVPLSSTTCAWWNKQGVGRNWYWLNR